MKNQLQNDRLIKALLRQPVDRPPVWIMRQAGRYLPEYREVRAQAGDFMSLCQNPELAAKVTLQPIERFDLDAAILFSDILTIPDAMGLGLRFEAGEGPVFDKPVKTLSDIRNLPRIDPNQDLRYVMNAVQTIQAQLAGRVPLIGFSGSPWTLACYMVEGGASKTFSRIKGMLYSGPKALHLLLDKLADAVADYLTAQIEAGVNAIQIFDTWGGLLSEAAYREFSLAYMQKIVEKLPKIYNDQRIPVILFTKGGGLWLEYIAQSGCDCVGLDWTVNLADAGKRIGQKVALQGNLDPCVLYGSDEVIRREVQNCLDQAKDLPGYVFNLGHGMHPDMDPAKLTVLIDAIQNG